MSPSYGCKQSLAAISRLWDAADYDRALAEVEALIGTWPGNAHLHVLRAGLIQLLDKPTHGLDEAKQSLERAIELDPTSPAAAIELGHFLDHVEDDPPAAAKAYAEGVAAARRLLIDGLLGQAKALRQSNKRDDLLRCLLEVLHLSRFGNRAHADGSGADLILELLAGHFHATQPDGPHAAQIQELLGEVAATRSA